MKNEYKITKDVLSGVSVCGEIEATKIEELCKEHFKNAKVVCWLHYALKFAIVDQNGILKMDEYDKLHFEKHLVRLRVFDADKELHVWKTQNALKYRLRADGKGKDAMWIDRSLVLNGTKDELTDSGLRITEDRGTEFLMPFFDKELNLTSEKRLHLITRNYIDYIGIGQASYVDCRFVDIKL